MQDLIAERDALFARQAEIEAALAVAMQAAKADLAAEIRDRIAAEGHDLGEVIQLLTALAKPKRNGKARPASAITGGWALKSDPAKVYTRGPTPKWMTEAMTDAGMLGDRKGFIGAFMARA